MSQQTDVLFTVNEMDTEEASFWKMKRADRRWRQQQNLEREQRLQEKLSQINGDRVVASGTCCDGGHQSIQFFKGEVAVSETMCPRQSWFTLFRKAVLGGRGIEFSETYQEYMESFK